MKDEGYTTAARTAAEFKQKYVRHIKLEFIVKKDQQKWLR